MKVGGIIINTAEEIRKKFANLTADRATELFNNNDSNASWAIKFKDAYAVAIEIDPNKKVNESFSNVSYFTDLYNIDGEDKYLLILSSSDKSLRNEFAGVCALFLELGENGNKRESIKKDPLQWWLKWKNLIGNKDVDATVNGVLGELITLYWLSQDTSKGSESIYWTGPEGKSVDIITDSKKVEVKTSLLKYNNIVTISGQYQLEKNQRMSLVYVKLEELSQSAPGINTTSIDDMISRLSETGFERDDLNNKVEKLGIKENSYYRKRTYRILDMHEYPVNDDFPLIDVNSFGNFKWKDRILQLSYKIELSGLERKEINLNLS